MTMIDKMAEAMYLNYAKHPDAQWDAVDPRMQEGAWRAHARAALLALLDPNERMVDAAGVAIYLDRLTVDVVRAAIRAALNEETP